MQFIPQFKNTHCFDTIGNYAGPLHSPLITGLRTFLVSCI